MDTKLIDALVNLLKGDLVQTHTSWVILTGEFVYKIKKPVNFGFLDYSTLEKRKENCQREVDLNKRLCPWIYLGVVPIVRSSEGYKLGGEGQVVEYAVKMRRVPEERLMKNLLDSLTTDQIRALSKHLWNFHQRAERKDEFGRLEVMKFNTDENFLQTEKYVGITIEEGDYLFIRKKTDEFYERHACLFEKRIKDGRIRDGHGDIRLEHVAFLDEGVCIFDCIEFNERFRCGDVLNDMCFLSMELDFYGRSDLAEIYEEEYKRLSRDPEFDIFLPFFKCYRAYVRGKVESFMLDDPNLPEDLRREHRERARRFFKLSRYYAEQINQAT
ncbi:gluconokinase [Thermocrinis sp.]|uniref:gluconokinase n=1 Tax=Thermocrinis sp. TaxID=2024383 RepID=UPI002FDE6DD4